MLNFKNSARRLFNLALNKYQLICDPRGIKTKILKNKKKSAYIASLAVLSIALSIFAANYRLGYEVKVEDVVLGTVATKGEYYEILDEVKTEVNNISEIDFEPVRDESFNMEIVSVNSFTKKEEIVENVKAIADGMQESFAITQNGQFVIALHSEEDAVRLKDEYLALFYDDKYQEVTYGAKVLVEKRHVPEDTIKDFDQAEEEFLAGKVETYTVLDGDTIEKIAESFNVFAQDILNDNEISEITVGHTLKIHTKKPIIPIKTVEYINGDVEIPYEIIKQEDSSVYEGQTRIKTEGKPGKKYLNAYITRVDGVITEEDIIKEQELYAPTAQIELVGTKKAPSSFGTGKFIMPTSGTLTSSFGRRWGRSHTGIDIASSVGTPIYATDNGIVIESEYQKNGYGNIIKIDHQNGFVSYYAHCSKLYANVGDVVAKGDLIASMGNTGRSTGPHLHFEIRKDDVPKNPYNYIKK